MAVPTTLIVSALFVVVALAAPEKSIRIVGGSDADIADYPYAVAFEVGDLISGFWLPLCGGTLITHNAVLTAAHCIVPYQRNVAVVVVRRARLGTSTLRPLGGSIHTLAALAYHPDYNSDTLKSDVAIVKLAPDVVFTDKIRPARLAGPSYGLPDDTLLTVVGWGANGFDEGASLPNVLQKLDIRIINRDYCAKQYEYLDSILEEDMPPVTEDHICAGNLLGGEDSCSGDSGGPLIHDGVVVGMVSFGFECARPNYPGVYTSVARFSQWIVENAQFDES